MSWTKDQLALLLARSKREPRKSLKRYLHDLGGNGSAEELDAALQLASASKEIQKMADIIDRERTAASEHISATLTADLTELRSQLKERMQAQSKSIAEIAVLCKWNDALVKSILDGDHIPSVEQLCKFASALDSRWRLQ